MISPIAVALAVALPLLLCLLMLFGIMLLRGRQLRSSIAIDLQRSEDKCAKLEKLLAVFPKAWDEKYQDEGFSRREVLQSYSIFIYALFVYVLKWIDSDDPENDSATRIELVLFPEPPPKHALTTSKDTRIFPNPHQYTPAEICNFLEQVRTRHRIVRHIMLSILLHAISFEGDPFQTLLPLSPTDMCGLDELKRLIRGHELSWNVRVHISKFGLYYAQKGDTKREFLALFKSLFEPYFKIKSPADVDQHQLELENFLDTAIQYGMKVVSQENDEMEYRWGARDDSRIMVVPPLHALEYEGEELKYNPMICQGESFKAKWD